MKKSNKRIFIINLKNYLEIAGNRALEITKNAESVSNELDLEIIISPPQPMLGLIAQSTKLKTIAQHVDINKPGASTGFFIPEMVKSIDGIGSLINHSEHPLKISIIEATIKKLNGIKLLSFVCVKNITELNKVIQFEPDYIAIEPPDLIGTEKSISTEKPDLISKAKKIISENQKKTKLICGAGISKKEDVQIAFNLGSEGILVASSITKANNWYQKIHELASVF